MASFRFMVDATADIPAALRERYDVAVIPMGVRLGGQEYVCEPTERGLDPAEFYRRMREGEETATTQINVFIYREAFLPIVQAGEDVLYLAFSTALTGCQQNARMAAAELMEEFPGRRIEIVDTRNASLAEVLLLMGAAAERDAGASLDEVLAWVERERDHVCCWVTVDNLEHLRRGGRLSATAAAVGTALNIKPIIHVDGEGRLAAADRVRGRKPSIKALAEAMEKFYIPERNAVIGIAHGDCLEDAQYLQKLIEKRFGIQSFMVEQVGPVIGAHTGPGTLAIFFIGETK